jgi:hypothetical protein
MAAKSQTDDDRERIPRKQLKLIGELLELAKRESENPKGLFWGIFS